MDNLKIIDTLTQERSAFIEAEKIAQVRLSDAYVHIEKLKTCLIQLQAQKEFCERLLSEETFFEVSEDKIGKEDEEDASSELEPEAKE